MNILALDGFRITKTGAVVGKDKIPCIKTTCPTCGKEFWARKRYRKTNPAGHTIFCSRVCFFKSDKYRPPYHASGKDHPSYKTGVCVSRGYTICSSGENHMKPIHRILAEKVLGRPLKRNEVVHHINGIKSDNRNSNLLICTASYHSFLHNRMSYLYMQEHLGGHND